MQHAGRDSPYAAGPPLWGPGPVFAPYAWPPPHMWTVWPAAAAAAPAPAPPPAAALAKPKPPRLNTSFRAVVLHSGPTRAGDIALTEDESGLDALQTHVHIFAICACGRTGCFVVASAALDLGDAAPALRCGDTLVAFSSFGAAFQRGTDFTAVARRLAGHGDAPALSVTCSDALARVLAAVRGKEPIFKYEITHTPLARPRLEHRYRMYCMAPLTGVGDLVLRAATPPKPPAAAADAGKAAAKEHRARARRLMRDFMAARDSSCSTVPCIHAAENRM